MKFTKLLANSFGALALFMILASFCFAQTDGRKDWGNVQKLSADTTLKVKLKTGEKIEGKITAVTSDSVSLSLSGGSSTTRELKKDEIAEVRRKSSARTAAFTGMLAAGGFFLGAAAGYGIGEASDSAGPIPDYAGAIIGVGVGAVCGVIIGNHGVLVYKVH